MNKQITIVEVLSAITKHRVKALISFALLMALVLTAYILLPRKYSSEGKLFVQLGRTGTGMDPTVSQTAISIQDTRETEIRSVAELVKSRAVIEKVIDNIGADKILKSPFDGLLPEFKIPTAPWNERKDEDSKSEYERLKNRELAARKLENSLGVHSEKKTCIVSVYVTAGSPELSQKIATELMASTQEVHVEVNSVKGSTAFFDETFRKKQATVVAAEKRLRNFRNENQFLSIEGAVATQQNVINKLRLDLIDAEIECSEAESTLKQIEDQMVAIKPIVSVPRSGIEKLSTEDSRTELFKLESELMQLQTRFNANHPRIRPLRESVAQMKKELKTMPTDRTELVSQINPVYEKVKVNLVSATTKAKSSRAKWEGFQEKFDQAMVRLAELNRKETDARQIQRELEIANQEMDIFVRKRTESTVIDELDQRSISDVVVAQKANFVVKPVSPKGSLFIPFGGIVSVLFAIATALYFEKDLLSGHLSEDEVEQILQLPILVSLPTVPSQRNMVG